jgi:hypothetical protein
VHLRLQQRLVLLCVSFHIRLSVWDILLCNVLLSLPTRTEGLSGRTALSLLEITSPICTGGVGITLELTTPQVESLCNI